MQLNTMFHNWLNKAGISDNIIEMFNIHDGTHSALGGTCIVIPVLDKNGKHIFAKYRRNPTDDTKPKYTMDRGARAALFGINFITDTTKEILVTEGEKDCLVAWSHNIPAVSSTGGAMKFDEEFAEQLAAYNVTFCFDNDEAGAQGMVRALKHIPNAKVMFLPDRPGVKDISDYVASGGDLHSLIKTARTFKNIEEVYQDRAERKALWKSTFFHEAYIKENSRPRVVIKNKVKFPGGKKERAKQVPISNILTLNSSNKCNCIWHNEKTPSLQYYPETNTVYCFGCGKYGDAIAVYMQKNNCSFVEAINKLS